MYRSSTNSRNLMCTNQTNEKGPLALGRRAVWLTVFGRQFIHKTGILDEGLFEPMEGG